MDINEAISYQYPFEWYIDSKSPIVNRLLKAIIEKDSSQMEKLFLSGATLKEMDQFTFRRTLYEVMEEYPVIKCLVDHGLSNIYSAYTRYDLDCSWAYEECFDPGGYLWGLLARAIHVRNYSVIELLAQNGFGSLGFCSYYDNGQGGNGLQWIRGDIKVVEILLENGFPRERIEQYRYISNDVIQYLNNHPLIHRKTLGLDPYKYCEIKKPRLENPIFFRKAAQERNAFLMEDYNDRVAAQIRLRESLGEQVWAQRWAAANNVRR